MDGQNIPNGHPGPSTSTAPRQRMPTVSEALPYTPFSTIIPFSPAVIPPPLAFPTSSPSLFSSAEAAQSARQALQELLSGAERVEDASARCRQTIADVKRLLDPEGLTQYQFRKFKPLQLPGGGERAKTKVEGKPLSGFSKMVFEETKIPFRYLTPESPEREMPSKKSSKPSKEAKEGKEANLNGKFAVTKNFPQDSGHVNGTKVTPSTNGKAGMLLQNGDPDNITVTPSSSAQQRKVQAVVVQNSLTPAQRAQYQYVPKSETSTGGQDMSSRSISISQQQKGDQAVHNLQNFLLEIFQAEDALEDDTGVMPEQSATYFSTREVEGEMKAVLQTAAQSKLEVLVHKTASCGRLDDIEVEYLQRVQRLCEPQVASLPSLSLSIGEEWSAEDIEEWLNSIRAAESGLAAARILIWIMLSASQNKELQSEDYLRLILDGLRCVTEACIIPIVQESALQRERIRGEKEVPPANPKFVVATDNRRELLSLLNLATKCLRSLGDLLVKTNVDDTEVSGTEYLCKTLIFAENASTDRDSALGIQNFETLRRCGMDVLAKIFTKYTEQRQYIFDEILMGLERLPATKQSARQYRLPGSKPIQLVSALLMRLVQTSATKNSEALKLRTKVSDVESDDEDEDASMDDSEADDEDDEETPAKSNGKEGNLAQIVRPLHDATVSNATYIVGVLIQRALSTTKSSDEPYRKLLDIFLEDFLNCLGAADWPAAELLLRQLTARMIGIIEKESSSVPSRTLALELLGNIGSGILDLQMRARTASEALDSTDTLARPLREMVKQLESGKVASRDVLAFDGPYRKVVEYVAARNTNDDAQLTTARGYYLMQWAFSTFNQREGSVDSSSSDSSGASKDLQSKLKHMLTDPHWFDAHAGLDSLTTAVGTLAAMVITLNSTFCRAFNRIFSILLTSMSSDSSNVKSRSIKSVVTLLEKDKTLLARNEYVLQHILRCASDSSPLVRDSALGLLSTCMAHQPSLSASIYKQIIVRTTDGAVGVRKRAMRMLKDIYLQSPSTTIRAAIATAIIARIEDTEESVIEIARTTMEEIWFQPLYPLKLDGERAVEARIAYAAHASLFVQTVEPSDDILLVVEALLRRLLTKSKAAANNAQVCKTLIQVMFDGIIDNRDMPGSPPQSEILRSLTVFARACPTLFTASQLERLEPYTQNMDNSDNTEVYRAVVIILRYVLPHQTVVSQTFLQNLGFSLLKSIPKLKKPEMREAVPCLWTVSTLVGETKRIANFLISLIPKIAEATKKNPDLSEDVHARRVAQVLRILGEYGNACDLSPFLADIKRIAPKSKAASVAELFMEVITPMTSPRCPLHVREAALDAVCSVSLASPKCFLRSDVQNAFVTVFAGRTPALEVVLLYGLESFFIAQETPEEGEEPTDQTGTDRLSKTYVASDTDGASIQMAQRFINDIIRISVSSLSDSAFVAARLVVSINKQGMVHPKDSVPALVALETSPNKAVAGMCFKEHKSQHAKHEGLYDKEYMRAVQRTFEYQQHVVGDAGGYLGMPPVAKMHLPWDVLKTAKAAVRKKFLSNVALKMDFDPAKLVVGEQQAQHLLFVRFCAENVAFVDYDRVDDLVVLVTAMEKVFAGTGSTVAQAVESEVLKIQVAGLDDSQPASVPVVTEIDATRLRQLATSAQILTLIWETRTFLIKLWNMQKHLAKAKQAKDKDSTRAPNRSTNAPTMTEAYIKRIAAICAPRTTAEECHATCAAFAELISVDNEVKVGSDVDAGCEDDSEMVNGYDTPSEGSKKSPSLPPGSASGKGRKRMSSVSGGPPKKRGRPSLGGKRKGGAKGDEDEDGWD